MIVILTPKTKQKTCIFIYMYDLSKMLGEEIEMLLFQVHNDCGSLRNSIGNLSLKFERWY